MKINIFWFRRDLRLTDNKGLFVALEQDLSVLPIFIFDQNILEELPVDDKRVSAIYDLILKLNNNIIKSGSSLKVFHSNPQEAFKQLVAEYNINAVFTNNDYEPYAIQRDKEICEYLKVHNIRFNSFKDQVIFEKNDIVKNDGKPYNVYTPYSNKWKEKLNNSKITLYNSEKLIRNFLKMPVTPLPKLSVIGFLNQKYTYGDNALDTNIIKNYEANRDFPSLQGTSRLSFGLRFGTIGIRKLVRSVRYLNEKYLNELVWREFYKMILWHYPEVVSESFRKKYDLIPWENNLEYLERWKAGLTGIPIVDAGMRELNTTGFMHNRVRMITASFLTKNLLIDWRYGETYFAEKLMDFDLSSNNGGWQWAAGCGVDAAPYFRVFNPITQAKKFDKNEVYIKKWVPEYGTHKYPKPIINLDKSRIKAIETYKKVLNTV